MSQQLASAFRRSNFPLSEDIISTCDKIQHGSMTYHSVNYLTTSTCSHYVYGKQKFYRILKFVKLGETIFIVASVFVTVDIMTVFPFLNVSNSSFRVVSSISEPCIYPLNVIESFAISFNVSGTTIVTPFVQTFEHD